MKNFNIHKILFGSLICFSGIISAQITRSEPASGEAGESFHLVTDRSHYISGEVLQFRAFSVAQNNQEVLDWSRVLYVELITSDGNALSQMKVPLEKEGGEGTMVIPTSIASGTYYLKAYTRWMRNCGPEHYSYTSVLIIDPFSDEVLPVDTLDRAEPSKSSDPTVSEYSRARLLEIDLQKEVYDSREPVLVDLTWNDLQSRANLCVSVAKKGVQGKQGNYWGNCTVGEGEESIYIPEIQGLSLSGQAISNPGSEPAAYATIYLSVLGENPNFFCNYSDSSGRFYFSFPSYTGERDLFVSTNHRDFDNLELLIDRDFSNESMQLPSYPVAFSDSTMELITELSVNAQVARQYYPIMLPQDQGTVAADERSFYGQPSATILFEDFIKLPRLEEYFIEVIPQVSVRKNRGVRSFQVLGAHPDLAIYQPLVMVDGVAIFDVEAVLAVSPRLIERVEIINAPYIRGNVTFGGIIHIISVNNDLGYIDLPASGLLVNYQMLDNPLPSSGITITDDQRQPDVRNTLYWAPNVDIGPGETVGLTFNTADVKGDYQVLLQGYDSSGQYIFKTIPFTVQ